MKNIIYSLILSLLIPSNSFAAYSVELGFTQGSGCTVLENYEALWSGSVNMTDAVGQSIEPTGPCGSEQRAVVDNVYTVNQDRYFQLVADFGIYGKKESNVLKITGQEFAEADPPAPDILWYHAQDYETIAGDMRATMTQPGGSISEETIISVDTASSLAAPDADRASYTINIPVPGTWYLWGRMYAKGTNGSNASNSFWIKFQNKNFKLGNRKDKFNVWYYGGDGQLESGTQSPINLGFLQAGSYVLNLHDREVLPQSPFMDLFVISNDPTYVPSDTDFCNIQFNSTQVDTDNDSVIDICDECPDDPDKVAPGQCGCGKVDFNDDGDTVALCHDNCPGTPNSGQENQDNDDLGDACDPCPAHPNTLPDPCGCDKPDQDQDTILDCIDNCPTVFNTDQIDTDSDNKGDACELKQECFDVNYDGSIPSATLQEILSRPVRDY